MLAYNNPKKEFSRQHIADVIDTFLPKQKINMFELIGGGVGAKFYDEKLDIGIMALVEQDKKLHAAFNEKELKGKGIKYRVSAQKFFKTVYPKQFIPQFFNVVNLDFCSWFYDNGMPSSTARIIDRVFKSNAITDTSLLFCTFQIDGLNLDLFKLKTGKDVPLTAIEHEIAILEIAEANGYSIELVFQNQYSSASYCRGQEMLNLGFQVTKK